MQQEPGVYDQRNTVPITEDRVVTGDARAGDYAVGYGRPATLVGENTMRVRDRVQWGPIAAGTLTTLATMLLLTVLGLAIGASAFEPGTDASDWGTAAGIWGGVSALIAFFLGGWVAARTAAVDGEFAGLMNGLITGAAALAVILWLTTTGVTNFLGFLGNNVADIAAIASETVQTASPAEADQAAAAAADSAYDDVEKGAWGTLIVLILALGAAAVGGLLGHNNRRELIAGTG